MSNPADNKSMLQNWKHLKDRAFTLLEMMIVVMIIALLVGMPMMRYIRAIDSARATEAIIHLENLRQSLLRYYMPTKDLTGVTLETLDVENPNTLPNILFTYNLTVPSATTFTVIATRNTLNNGNSADTISVNQDGTKWGTGSYSGVK